MKTPIRPVPRMGVGRAEGAGLRADPVGGGFVFATVHNIQANVPPENLLAMRDALREHGAY